MNRSNDATRRRKLLVASTLLSLALSSCVDFAQDSRHPTNDHKSPATKETSPPGPAKDSNNSAENQNKAQDPIAPADGGNEASSDELENNTPLELRQLTRCIIEEDVRIAPDGEGRAPFKVSFDSSAAVAPCGKIVKSIWSFGDGAKASGTRVTHTYSAPGEYIVKLNLTDNNGNRNLLDIEYVVIVIAEKTSIERRPQQATKPSRRATERSRP